MLRLLVVGWYLMWSGLGTRVFLDQGVMLREHGRVYTNVDDRFVSLYKKVALPRMSMENVQKLYGVQMTNINFLGPFPFLSNFRKFVIFLDHFRHFKNSGIY